MSMEARSGSAGTRPAVRRFREAGEEPAEAPASKVEEVCIRTGLPLEVNMTDEPGGDPYNHKGRFRRMYR
jgi:hypothetical protein